jgi:hypothetical protein
MSQKMLFCFTNISIEVLLHGYATAFAQRAIFWHTFAKCCCHLNHRKLFPQKLLSFGAKNIDEIDHWQ